ncbi:hypothetical protein [Oceanirhabdus sp. W0125-5]|uniref:hypothetical protein n=1 Tax=Oceanirhabdus sp. W0125-5 TaxID=2999116 RepID=UPI0022F2BF53|nr:hypothetical protein [Oceanirhabdus sp. W0125-5]WBW96702.1 hypothetical protein OW730_23860 [Oceanirhabdus sp. W0125-5]
MRKIIFSGICMLISAIGIIAMIIVSLNGNKVYGSINGSTDMLTYLNLYGVTPIFSAFCLLGILGLCIGLWGIIDKSNSK